MPATLPAGVRLRGSVYQIRIGIPDDVRHLWPRQKNGKPAVDAYRKSLGTSDRNEAAAKAHALIAEYQAKFEKLRADSRPKSFTPITDDLVGYIVEKAERDVLAADDVLRSNPDLMASMMNASAAPGLLSGKPMLKVWWATTGDYLNQSQFHHLTDVHEAIVRALQIEVATGQLDAARRVAHSYCESMALRVDWTQPTARTALQRILRAILRAWKGAAERDKGEPVETPSDPQKPASVTATPEEPAAPPMTLRDVLPSWKTRTSARPNAISRAEHALKLFEQAVGVVPVTELTKASGVRFLRFLLDETARGFGRKTANNHASAISALMNVAVKDDLIALNPFDLSIDTSIGAEKREPWTDEQLRRIYSHKLFSDGMSETPRWHDVDPADGRALLLMLLHTGARIGEIAQLRREDFLTRSGLVSIRITAEAGTVKTQESERVVPLAEHLLADPWFSTWLEGVMGRTGNAMPTMCRRARGPSDTAGQWFRYFRKAVGLPSGALEGSHKFRHWIRSALAEKHVGEATADAITGHAATGSSGRKVYTATASLKAMREALDRLEFPVTTA